MQTDEELMLSYRNGHMAAFETLVRRHRGPVLRYLWRMLRNQALAEEVLAESFFKLHRAAPAYEPRARFTTFLYSIVYNLAIDVLRRGQVRSALEAQSGPEGAYEPEAAGLEADLAERYEAREQMAALHRALDLLPEIQKHVFLLYYQDETSAIDIAAVLNIPHGSVRSYLCLARRALREALEAGEAVRWSADAVGGKHHGMR